MEKQVNNKFIQPDPAKMEKVPAQMMIYDGAGWLEISNQQTINDFGKITTDLSTEASKTREYVDRLDEEFKQADSEILKTIKTETAKLDESITNAKLDTKNVDQRVTEIDSQNKQKVEEIKNNLTLIDKKLDDSQAQNQQAVADLQKQAGEMKISVAEQLKNKSVEIAEAKQQAIDNANAAIKSFETDVTTKFENANGQISQMVTKTDHNNLAKRVGSNTTLINQNQHAIELKADRTEVDETNTKISDLSSSLAVANDAIKAKAEKTDVDKLAGRVDKAETNLELTSQQIKLKADSSTVNDLTGSVNVLKQSALTVDSDKIRGMTSEIERANQRITDTNTLTEQNANTIKTLATKTEINELTQTVSQSKSELNQTIDGIRASVTSVNTKVDSLAIGGTNLLGGTSTDIVSKDAPASGWIEGVAYTTPPLSEKQYVLSFEAKGDVDNQRIGTFLYAGGLGGGNISKKATTSLGETFNASDGQAFITLTTEWKKYWVLYDVGPDNTKKMVIVGRRWANSNPSGKIYVRKVKLETGNKASDWSPAPEDMLNKYASLDVKVSGINSTVATKADKSYVDQRANEINSVVANKSDMSYVNQKADQWQVALQGLNNDTNSKIDALSGLITANKNDLTSLYESETYKGMQKIVQNSAFLQNANGFTTQVQSVMSDELKQINLVYNSEFEPGNGQEIEGWAANHPLKRGTNVDDNYYGSATLGMDTFSNATDQWVKAWSQMIDVNEGDHLSASVVAFYTGGIVSTTLGTCGIEIELFERVGVNRKTFKGSYKDIVNIPRDHEKTIRIDDYTIPSGITKARIGLVIKGKGNVMFAHPMLVKGTRAGIYQPSVVNKLSKLTQTLDGLKSEVHDGSINSVIGQTARMIALQISGDKNKVISQINASTEGIMIDGKHIMINGNTRIQGTLMVNDVVMKSQNNAVKFSPESLDMIGANSMLKLQSDSIQLGATSTDPRKQWGIGLSKNGLAVTVPVKKPASVTNTPEDYQREIQGYINGGGWDYTKAEAVGSGASGIEIGLMAQQVWGDPYGGDYIAIGQYIPTNSQKTSRAFTPAISYSETGVGWAPRDIHMYKPATFHSEVHMKVPSTGYGIRTAWVSWSDWRNEKYPCIVNDSSNWGGIAFSSDGIVVMFDNTGKRFNLHEMKDHKYEGYGDN